ncbi:hypothetical protein SCOR_28560 [Sulfidibacter corallicola]|uniref:Uncharacterized protein n=1 Tax=Sulfidibacter corallicola TaxID=2818388 RepID=A0A8A4TNL7_SULCO|nr:hypothetical protein [Sulfidibacter corallicola]QTD50491.1 hypothetical protein J3U87_33320 [Sulfidibacter corallicola]
MKGKSILGLSLLVSGAIIGWWTLREPKPRQEISPALAREITRIYGQMEHLEPERQTPTPALDATRKVRLARSLARACGPLEIDDKRLRAQYLNLNSNQARLEWRLEHLYPDAAGREALALFRKLVVPYDFGLLETLAIDEEQPGHAMLEAFFLKVIEEGERQDQNATRQVARARILAQLSPDAVSWLGIERPHRRLVAAFQAREARFERNQQSIRKHFGAHTPAEQALGSCQILLSRAQRILTQNLACLNDSWRILGRPLLFADLMLRQQVRDLIQPLESDRRRLGTIANLAKQLDPILADIRTGFDRRFQQLSASKLTPSADVHASFARLGRPASKANDLYQLTTARRRVPIMGSKGVTGITAHLVPASFFNRVPAGGLVDPQWVRLQPAPNGLEPFRDNHVRLVWRERIRPTKETESQRYFRDLPTGIRLFGVETGVERRANQPHYEISPLDPSTGDLDVDLATLNRFLQNLGVPSYLQAISAQLHLEDQQLSLDLTMALPALSQEIHRTIQVNLTHQAGNLETALTRKTQTLSAELVAELNQAFDAGRMDRFSPRHEIGGLSAANIESIVYLGGKEPFKVRVCQSTLLGGLPLIARRTFALEGDRLRELEIAVSETEVKTIVLVSAKGSAARQSYRTHHHRARQSRRDLRATAARRATDFVDRLSEHMSIFEEPLHASARDQAIQRITDVLAEISPTTLRRTALPISFWGPIGERTKVSPEYRAALLRYEDTGITREQFEERLLPMVTEPSAMKGHVEKDHRYWEDSDLVAMDLMAERWVYVALSTMRPGPGYPIFRSRISPNPDSDSMVEVAAFYTDRLIRVQETWWHQWRASTVQALRAIESQDRARHALVDPVSREAIDLRTRIPGIDDRGHLNLGVTLQPTVLAPYLETASEPQRAGLVWTGSLEAQGVRGLPTGFLDRCRTIHGVVTEWRRTARQMDLRLRDRWRGLAQSHPTGESFEAKALLLEHGRPRITCGLDIRALSLNYDGTPMRCDGRDLVLPLTDLATESPTTLNGSLTCARDRERELWQRIHDDLRTRLPTWLTGLNDPNLAPALAALAELKNGTPWAELSEQHRQSLPTEVSLFGTSLPVTYHFAEATGLTLRAADSEGTVFGSPFEVHRGLGLNLDQGRAQVVPQWSDLVTAPTLDDMVIDRLAQLLPGLSIDQVTAVDDTLLIDLTWLQPALGMPLSIRLALSPAALDPGVLIRSLGTALRRALKRELERNRELPTIGPFESIRPEEPEGCPEDPAAIRLAGVLKLAGYRVHIVLESCSDGSISVALDGRIDRKASRSILDHPILQGLDIQAEALADPGFRLDGGFRLNFRATVQAKLPGAVAHLDLSFYLDEKGLHFEEQITLHMPGWLDSEELGDDLSLGDVFIRFDPKTRKMYLEASLSLEPGAETSEKIMVTLAGTFGLDDPEWSFTGDLFLFRFRAANVKVRLNIHEKTAHIRLDSDLMMDLLELEGEILLKNSPAAGEPTVFAKLTGDVLGVTLADARLKLQKDGSGKVEAGIGLPWLDRNRIEVDYDEDFENPRFTLKTTDDRFGPSITWVIGVNERECSIGAQANVLGYPLEAHIVVPSLKHFDIEAFLRDLLDIRLDLGIDLSSSRVKLADKAKEDDGKSGSGADTEETGGAKSAEEAQPVYHNTPQAWIPGWKVVREPRKKRIFKPLSWFYRTVHVPVKKPRNGQAGALFGALGHHGGDAIADIGGYYKVQDRYGLIRDKHGTLHLLFRNGGRWQPTGWTCGAKPYSHAPEDDTLEIVNHRDHEGHHLAILTWNHQTLAMLRGATLGAQDARTRNITRHFDRLLANRNDLGPHLKAELAWYIGYFHHQGQLPEFKSCGTFFFVFTKSAFYVLVPRSDGDLLLVSFALLGHQALEAFTLGGQDCAFLDGLTDVPLTYIDAVPPGPAMLLLSQKNEVGLLLERAAGADTGNLFLLHDTGNLTGGTWRWHDRAEDQTWDRVFRQQSTPQTALLEHMLAEMPRHATPLHLGFRYRRAVEEMPMRLACSGGEAWLGFGDEFLTLGREYPRFHWADKTYLDQHWSAYRHQSLMGASHDIPTTAGYGALLLSGRWQDDTHDFRGDPLGPLVQGAKEMKK